jgi:hypothetical protein
MKQTRSGANKLKPPPKSDATDINIFGTDTPKDNTDQVLARQRRQADSLNELLPALGCKTVDIDSELKRPPNPALLPAKSKHTKKHKKK